MYAFEFEGLVVYAPGNKTPVAGATWRQLTVCCAVCFSRSRCLVNLDRAGPLVDFLFCRLRLVDHGQLRPKTP